MGKSAESQSQKHLSFHQEGMLFIETMIVIHHAVEIDKTLACEIDCW